MKNVIFVMLIIFILTSCVKEMPYNAKIYDDAGEWMYEEFLVGNLTRGVFYDEEYLDDDSYPTHVTHLINNKEEFDSIFTEFPAEIDFDKSILAIYIFTCNYVRPYELKNVFIDNQTIKIEIEIDMPQDFTGSAVPSWQRCIVVEMDKLDVTTVEFIEK
ncbi:MAG: hypothetical protein PHO86_06865 [Bacilli bacterium]|nr:hypothetical protein [Bacilli bacterium]